MNPRIPKIRAEIEKNNDRIVKWQEKNRVLQEQLDELEKLDIFGMVREVGMTPEQLAELLADFSQKNKPKKEDSTLETD